MAETEPPDASGFDEFFREWFPKLASLGAAMSGRRDVGNDIAQESMVRAHQRWAEVGEFDRPGSWVRRVAVNLLIDHQRSVTAERGAVARLERHTVGRAADTAALDRWTELTSGLPERQRVIVTLYYADDQSVDAIADLLDIAPGTVKAQLFKARATLRDRLTDELPDTEEVQR